MKSVGNKISDEINIWIYILDNHDDLYLTAYQVEENILERLNLISISDNILNLFIDL